MTLFWSGWSSSGKALLLLLASHCLIWNTHRLANTGLEFPCLPRIGLSILVHGFVQPRATAELPPKSLLGCVSSCSKLTAPKSSRNVLFVSPALDVVNLGGVGSLGPGTTSRAGDTKSTFREDFGAVNFEQEDTQPRSDLGGSSAVALGCTKPCTRILKPIRGRQGNSNPVFANLCVFQIKQCEASRSRSALPLELHPDQNNVIYPSTSSVWRTSCFFYSTNYG
jgi:hypothetical protein